MAKRPVKRPKSGALKEYDAKRDFSQSPEPPPKVGKKSAAKALAFCVQKHLASHLHYDFRLEHAGVLLSWAVPKGPSLNPADKRMAMHVEDHPVDYGSFEGVIPSGYGAGIVMLWDRGTWTPERGFEDIAAGLKKGELKFTLDGVKLKGSWVLVRTKQRFSGPEQWLLIKHRDQWSGDVDIAAEAPLSVKSFGDLPDIAAANDEVLAWRTKPPVKGGETGKLLADVLSKASDIRSGKRKGVAAKKSVWHSETKDGSAPAEEKSPPRSAATRKKATKKPTPKPVSLKMPKAALATSTNIPTLSNPKKVMYPETGFTKGEVVEYYRKIAPLMLPHLVGRAVTMKRYPDGVDGKMFFEKRCPDHRPDWVKTARFVTSSGKAIDQCDIADVGSLLWAANLAAIELHTPLSHADDPERPTAMVFDLDPGEPATVADCATIALRLKSLLDQLKLVSVIKTSGGKGLHVLVPLTDNRITFDDTKAFANAVAKTLEKDDPKHVIASMSRAARAGKVFIDWSQNDRNKTTACVFSLRARPTPTISWPIAWATVKAGRAIQSPRADAKLDVEKAMKALHALQTRQRLPNLGKAIA